jgi:signal peptidase I
MTAPKRNVPSKSKSLVSRSKAKSRVAVTDEQMTGAGISPEAETPFASVLAVADADTREDAALLAAHVDQLRGRQNGAPSISPPRPRQTERLESRRAHRPFLRRFAIFVAVAVAAVALIHAFLIEPFTVPGKAMTPTLKAGDRILTVKSGLLGGAVHSGDIVVFRAPQDLRCTGSGSRTGDLVLRVVATPGQVISSKADTVLINGRALAEPGWFDRTYGAIGAAPIHTTTLGSGQYYVMADDRLDGCDSRAFGPIEGSSIVAKAFAVVSRGGHLSISGV